MDKPPVQPKVQAGDAHLKTDQPPPPRLRRIWSYRKLLVIALIVLIADQLSKQAIVATLPYPSYGAEHGAITVISNFFYIVHVGNTGAAELAAALQLPDGFVYVALQLDSAV